MPNADISRYLNQPRKHYRGARLQQGRPLLDSDFNEGVEAGDDGWRTAMLDIIGAKASRDEGFMPALRVGDRVTSKLVRFGASTQAFVLDYPLKSGSMYVGGALWEQDEPEPVIFQREFLQMGAATAPRPALGEQRQLSYLRGWEQPVTAIEDGEILEPSLGGADAATRVRRVRRVEVRNVKATDCAAAFAEVLEDLGAGDTATYDASTCELRSNARLRMTFQGSPAVECGPCQPSLEGRYLGGESQAIRIMLTGPDRFVWAFDNAAPLYRVRLVLDGGGGARVDMLTQPKDTFHYPRQHMVVEFLPWEALLDNGKAKGGSASGESFGNEKIAAHVGILGEVDGTFDTAARTFHVRLAPGSAQQIGVGTGKSNIDSKSQKQATLNLKTGTGPTEDGFALRWDERHPFNEQLNPNESSPEGFVTYLYMRVWQLQTDSNSTLTIPTSSGKPLGATGLVPVFKGRGRAGDFWTVAVRPEAPDEILPREIMLEGGSPPHGPREVLAQISLLTWRSTTGSVHEVVAIDDCRPTLTALTERACCTYDVGPGGDFETIQAAVNALPLDGGRICVREGVYPEEIRIKGKSNVLLVGCGTRTRIVSPEEVLSEALVSVELSEDKHDVTLRDLTIEASGQIGVRALGGSRVELRRVAVTQTSGKNGLRSAVQTIGTSDVRITRCPIEMGGAFSHHAAVYIDTPAGAFVEGNKVETLTDRDNGFSYAWGGIQVAGGSRDVEIRDNVIIGGRGHAVTLGSVVFRALDGSRLDLEGAGRGQSNPAPPFAVTGIFAAVTADPDSTGSREFFPEPQPAIEELVISDNRIEGAGGSGISTLALQIDHDKTLTGPPLCFRRTTFALANAVIEDNRIFDNARQRAATDGERVAVGGIVISDAVGTTIRSNLVEANGSKLGAPVCGICVARGEHISLVSNRVRGNGPPTAVATPGGGLAPSGGGIGTSRLPGSVLEGVIVPRPRFHGGIVIAPPEALQRTDAEHEDSPRNIHLRRNVVDQPAAVAAFVQSRGTCLITGNHFHSHSLDGRMIGPTVLVFSAGKPWEAVDLPEGEPNPDRWRQPKGSREYLNGRAQELPDGDGGALCFNGNQVTTNGASKSPSGGFDAVLVSLDHLSVVGNQFAARSREPTSLPQVLAIGLTTDVSINRVAESLNRTQVSLAALGSMLTACAGNQLTHCPAIFGCGNHGNPEFFVTEDNLVWFQPRDGRCERAVEPLIGLLSRFCNSFFGRTRGVTFDLTNISGGQL
ncbi:MAG: hypothetical protein QOH51_962 [Acidobacteriota bacterium]|jgi:hypothetical protein|nr:hypothetical protein [Acidobacteriota bacterium]